MDAPPIVEELTFRKALYGFFYRRLGPVVAIIASSLVFGLLHVASYGDFIQAIVYVPMGAVLGIFYYLSKRNVHVTIGIHFINNFISFLIYAFAAYGVTLFA